jgi:hypothetical protein
MEKSTYDRNQPQGSMSLRNLRNTLRSLHQGDLMPLRPSASLILDDMEYPTLTGAASVFVPENCSVSGTSIAVEGNYSLNIEGTGVSGTITKTENLDLSNMSGLSIWNRGDTGASQNYTLWMKDNGENADLSDIVNWGFKIPENLDFKIDTVEAECGMCVAIDGVDSSSYYRNVYVSNTPTTPTRQSSPIITAPITNSRIDILYLNKDEELNFLVGDELATPVPDWDSVTGDMFLICLIYCRPGMIKIVDFINHEANPSEGYIAADIRPLFTGRSELPQGCIIMWHGTLANIPGGYALCDGDNGTPNLLDKFVIGVANAVTDPGATGGSYSVTLTEAQLPIHTHIAEAVAAHSHAGSSADSGGAHTHTASSNSTGSHTHSYDRLSGGRDVQSGDSYHYSSTNTGSAGNHSHTITVDSGGSHTHTLSVSADGGHTPVIGNTGSGSAITLPKPEYYAVAFIMKI